jgi:hypothetical protein
LQASEHVDHIEDEKAQVNSPVQLDPVLTMPTITSVTRPTWEQAEGSPLPLGVTWIEEEQAFNFAVHAEHAESVTLLLYTQADLINSLLAYRPDFLQNKTGRIWHCASRSVKLVRLTTKDCATLVGTSMAASAAGPLKFYDALILCE